MCHYQEVVRSTPSQAGPFLWVIHGLTPVTECHIVVVQLCIFRKCVYGTDVFIERMAKKRQNIKIKGWKHREFLRFLRKNGCGIEEGVGGHKIAIHPDDPKITASVPDHGAGQELAPFVVNKVLKAMGLK